MRRELFAQPLANGGRKGAHAPQNRLHDARTDNAAGRRLGIAIGRLLSGRPFSLGAEGKSPTLCIREKLTIAFRRNSA
jgi:hypothetical protein